MKKKGKNVFFVFIRNIVGVLYRNIKVEGIENIPKEPCLIIGNHSQIYGPLNGELYYPGKNRVWCTGEMMKVKEVPAYAMKDFWPYKKKSARWFYKILSYLIAPLCSFLFKNAKTIPVYKDARMIITFRRSMECLAGGENIVIFPENHEPFNNIVNEFQDKFIDVARMHISRY